MKNGKCWITLIKSHVLIAICWRMILLIWVNLTFFEFIQTFTKNVHFFVAIYSSDWLTVRNCFNSKTSSLVFFRLSHWIILCAIELYRNLRSYSFYEECDFCLDDLFITEALICLLRAYLILSWVFIIRIVFLLWIYLEMMRVYGRNLVYED